MHEDYFTVHLNNMKRTSYNKWDKRTQCDSTERNISYLSTLSSVHKHINIHIDKVVVFDLYMRTLHFDLFCLLTLLSKREFLNEEEYFEVKMFSQTSQSSHSESSTGNTRVKVIIVGLNSAGYKILLFKIMTEILRLN